MRQRQPTSLRAREDVRYLEVSQKVKRLKAATESEASEANVAAWKLAVQPLLL